MGCLAQQFTGLKWPPLSSSGLRKPFSAKQYLKPRFFRIVAAVATSNAETKGRLALKEEFEEAYERCRTAPMEAVSFTLEDFYAALDKYDFSSEIGDKVEGTVLFTNNNGALVDIRAKCLAFLPVHAACIRKIKHVEEAGIFPDMRAEFLIVGENQSNDSLILSLRSMQNDLSWERCRQLQAEDVIVKGKVVGVNKGGLEVLVENLDGFVPFSQLSSKSTAEELLERELPLKFLNVDEKKPGIVLSNRKAMEELLAQLPVGSVVTGIVQSVKPYGAFIDIGGINGLLHVGQISHDRVSEISAVLQPGDTLKVMIISHDRKKGRISLSTKKLEPTPGDMIRNPKLVFEKAEVMAQTFRQRIAQAEAMARADMLRFQPESRLTLNSDGILMPLSADLPEAGLDLSDVLPALKTQS